MNPRVRPPPATCPFSWLTVMSNSLFLGPKPSRLDDLRYLTEVMGVTIIVNLMGSEKLGRMSYVSKIQKYHELYPALDRLALVDCPLEIDNYQPKGRLKTHQNDNLALFYARHAKTVKAALVQYPQDNSVIYIHGRDGLSDEVYVAFAYWRLTAKAADHDFSPLEWIRDYEYEMLLNDEPENLALLKLVWDKAGGLNESSAYFEPKTKKSKKQEEEG